MVRAPLPPGSAAARNGPQGWHSRSEVRASFITDWDLLDITGSTIYELLQRLLGFGSAEVKLSSSRSFMLCRRQVVRKYRGFSQYLAGGDKLHPGQRVKRRLPESIRSQTCLEGGLAFGILVPAMPAVELAAPEIAYRAREITVGVDAFRSKLPLKRQPCVFLSHPLLNKVCCGGT